MGGYWDEHDKDPVFDPRTPTHEEHEQWRERREKLYAALVTRLMLNPSRPSKDWKTIHSKFDDLKYEAGGSFYQKFLSDEYERISDEFWDEYKPKDPDIEREQ